MGRRILNDALSTIVNAEKRGFASAQLQPISNVISSFHITKATIHINFWVGCSSRVQYRNWKSAEINKSIPQKSTKQMGRKILNDALSTIMNAEKRGFASAQLQPISNVISSFHTIMKHRGYVKNFEVHGPHRVGKNNVELLGMIKGCRAITYRQDIKAHEIENYRLRTLPTQQWGYVVITTPNGVLDHEEAI